jgi:integrase/recombinase XerD
MKLSEAFEAYRDNYMVQKGLSEATADNYHQTLMSAIRVVSDMPLELMTYEEIKRWHKEMINHGLNQSSRRCHLSRMKNVLRYYTRKGIIAFDIDEFELPKEPKRRPKYITPEEVGRLIHAAQTPRNQLIISLLFSTGIRVGELTRINRRDIHEHTIDIKGKGSVERTVLVDPITMLKIKTYLITRHDNDQPLLRTKKTIRIGKAQVEKIVRDASDAADLSRHVTPHILRHSHATDLLSNGADLRYIQHHLGHADISTTVIYTHVIEKDMEKVYNKYHTIIA